MGRIDGRRDRLLGIGVTVLVAGTYDTDIITDAGTTDCRDFDGPYSDHHRTMDRRGRLATQRAARRPEQFATGLARALDDTAPFARRAAGPDARMLLLANRILPAAAMHQCTRLILGLPRFGSSSRAASGLPAAAVHPQESESDA